MHFDLSNAGTYMNERTSELFLIYLWFWGRESQCLLIHVVFLFEFYKRLGCISILQIHGQIQNDVRMYGF